MKHLRNVRVSLTQLLAVCVASAVATAVVVIEADRESTPERAVIAALRTPQVVHAHTPVVAAIPPTSAAASAGGGSGASVGSSGSDGSVGSSGLGSAGAGGSAGGSDGGVTSTPATSTPAGGGSSDSGGSDGSDQTGTSPTSSTTPTTTPTTSTTTSTTSSTPIPTSPVKHVFVIALETPSYAAAFGRGSEAKYLTRTLRRRGALLSGYRTLDAGSTLPDLDALVSGQVPNRETSSGCPTYSEFPGGAKPHSDGLVPGAGCIYPTTALTLGDDLDGSDLPWRGYIGGMSSACQHPDSGAADPLPASGYATSRNPFVYFHSLLDLGDCQSNDLPLGRLAAALKSAKRTPSFSLISPDMCASGETETCAGGAPAGVPAADAFLRTVVPEILRSAAYRSSGALLILFGGTQVPGPGTAPTGSSTTTGGSTTSTTTGTGTAGATSTTTTTGTGTTTSPSGSTTPTNSPPQTPTHTGSRRTGALLISPFTRAGSTDTHRYDAYSVLHWLTSIFAVDALGQAKETSSLQTDLIRGG